LPSLSFGGATMQYAGNTTYRGTAALNYEYSYQVGDKNNFYTFYLDARSHLPLGFEMLGHDGKLPQLQPQPQPQPRTCGGDGRSAGIALRQLCHRLLPIRPDFGKHLRGPLPSPPEHDVWRLSRSAGPFQMHRCTNMHTVFFPLLVRAWRLPWSRRPCHH
jgi:hypothetical protein